MKRHTNFLMVFTVVAALYLVMWAGIVPCAAGDFPGKWYGWYNPDIKLLAPESAYREEGWAHPEQKILNSWGYKANDVEEIKGLLPGMFYNMVKDPQSWGNIRINETAYVPRNGELMKRFNAATEKYKGQPYVDEEGELQNFKAGVPFPGTEDSLELAWNFTRRATYCDAMRGLSSTENCDVKGRFRGSNQEMNVFHFDRRLFGDRAPLWEPNPNRVEELYAFGFLAPYSLRGNVMLTIRYLDPKDDDMWMYLPSLRRARRMSTAQRWDRVPGGGVSIWEIIQGFSGKVKNNDWKYLGRKELLCGHNASPEAGRFKDKGGGPPNQYYQRVNTIMLQYTPKPRMHAPVSKCVMYIDPETYQFYYNEIYDKKGKPYIFSTQFYSESKNGVVNQAWITHHDVQRIHSSIVFPYAPTWNEEIPEINNPNFFELDNLRTYFGSR